MRKILILLLLLFGVQTSQLWAWGQKGHRIIGQIAYNHLNAKAKKKINQILGEQGTVYWSNWADEIKSDTIYPDSYGWHFQDLDAGISDSVLKTLLTNYPKSGGELFCKKDSIFALLQQYPENKDALCFLVHLVGDFFCPLHIGHESDKGGNTIKMQWFNQNINLHKVWDSYLIESQGYSYNEYAQYLEIQFSSQQQSLEKMTEADFLIHNYHLSCDIYDYQKKWDGNTYHYIYHFVHNMEWQLYAGGIYLACLLNELYK